MNIIRRYITKEIVTTLSATLIILLSILLVQRLALMLNDAASSGMSFKLIFSIFGVQLLKFTSDLFPISFLMASIMAFGRLYKDSEMTAMYALGIPIKEIYRLLFYLALPFSFILILLNF